MDYYLLVEQKYRAWKKYSYFRKRDDNLKYCQIRNKVPRCIIYAERKFERGIAIAVKAISKTFWKFIRPKTTTRTGIGNSKNEDDKAVTDDKDKGEIFNSYASSVFTA